MPEAATRPPRARRTPLPISAAGARTRILVKLEKAGAKGAPSVHPAKISDVDRAIFAAELRSLELEETVFVDRRKATPKYYLWNVRPFFPTAASVAEELAALSARRFPSLLAEADFKKFLSKQREKADQLYGALGLLMGEHRLIAFTYRSGKKEQRFYVAAQQLRAGLAAWDDRPTDGATRATVDFGKAYTAVVGRTGFPAVMLSELLKESGAELSALHAWLLGEHRGGRAVLSLGDWSLASETERAAALSINSERYLQARLLTS